MIQDIATQTKSPRTTEFAATVEQIRGSISGELIGRAAAIDHLLDLRSAVRDRPEIVARVDAVLVEVPGQRTVAAAWLGVVITDLERLVALAGSDTNWVVPGQVGSTPPPAHRSEPQSH